MFLFGAFPLSPKSDHYSLEESVKGKTLSVSWPCKTAPQFKSHSLEQIFSQRFEKVLALCLVCGQSQDTQLEGSLKKLGHLILSFVSGCF